MPLHCTFRPSLVNRITSYSVDLAIETTAPPLLKGTGSSPYMTRGHHELASLVIPTGAYPDFLLRAASNNCVCGSPQREPHGANQRHESRQEIRGSAVEGSAVSLPAATKLANAIWHFPFAPPHWGSPMHVIRVEWKKQTLR